jgi:hypothetical protein
MKSALRAVSWAVLAMLLGGAAARAADVCADVSKTRTDVILQNTCSALHAINVRDARALASVMADDFALTSVSGRYYEHSRSEMVGRWTAPPPAGVTGESRLAKVFRSRQSGSNGFVAGVIEDRETRNRVTSCQQHAFTDTWERRRGKWVWVQSHESGARDCESEPTAARSDADAASVVQRQVDAYNSHDLDAFVATYSEDVLLYRVPATTPALAGRDKLAAFYRDTRFNRPQLHAEILARTVIGNKVIDHERISGLRAEPFEAVAAYVVEGGLIRSAWLFYAE